MDQMSNVASMLQRLSDQQLQQELQHPGGNIPQFLVLSEVQRRKAMRATQQKPVDATPVAQEMQGIAGAPQMAGSPTPAGAGGIQSFAEGGEVKKKKWYEFGPDITYPQQTDDSSIDLGPIWDKIKNIGGNVGSKISDAIANDPATPMVKGWYNDASNALGGMGNGAWEDNGGLTPYAGNTPRAPQQPSGPIGLGGAGGAQGQGGDYGLGAPRPQQAPQPQGIAAIAPQTPPPAGGTRGMRNNNPGNIMGGATQWQGQTGVDGAGYAIFDTMENGERALRMNLGAYGSKHGVDTISGAISRWAPPGANPTAAYIKFVSDQTGIGANDKIDLSSPDVQAKLQRAISAFENGKGGVASVGASSRDASGSSGSQSDISKFLLPVDKMPDRVTAPTMRTAADELPGVQNATGDITQQLLDANDKRALANAGRKDSAFNMALMQAGLGMMASRSPYAMQGIGEGGLQGLKGYTTQMSDINDKDATLQQHRDAIAMQQQALKAGNYKTAADIANQTNTRQDAGYRGDIAQRKDDISNIRDSQRFNAGVLRDVSNTNMWTSRDDASIERARIAAAAKTGSGADASWKENAKEADQANTLFKIELSHFKPSPLAGVDEALKEREYQQFRDRVISKLPAQYRRHIVGSEDSSGIPGAMPASAPMQKRYIMQPDGSMQAQ